MGEYELFTARYFEQLEKRLDVMETKLDTVMLEVTGWKARATAYSTVAAVIVSFLSAAAVALLK